MAKPILEVEVKDEQVKRLLEMLAKVQKTVEEEIPAGWRSVNESMKDLGGTFAVNFDLMMKQQKALHDEVELRHQNEAAAKKEADLSKAKAKDAEKAAKLEKKVLDDRAKANKKTIDDTKKIAGNVASAAISIAKWVGLGGLAGAATGALGFWGLDGLTKGVGNERRLAQGFGVSTAERQSLGVNFQRYFDVNGALGQMSDAQTDAGKQWIFSSLGIRNAQGKDAAELTLEAAQKAHDLLQRVPTNQIQQFSQARGLDQIFSLSELRTLKGLSQGELNQAYGNYGGDLKKFALNDEVGRKWQDFTRKLDEAGWALKNNFMDHLVKAEPGLINIIDAFEKVAASAIDHIDWDVIAKGVKTFGDYLASDKFQNDVREFMDEFSQLAKWTHSALEFLGIIKRTPEENDALRQKRATEPWYDKLLDPTYNIWDGFNSGPNPGRDDKEPYPNFGGRPNATNPGNLRKTSGLGFQAFATPDDGIRAAARQLQRYEDEAKWGHADTIAKIIRLYAPASDHNDTAAYINNVSRASGFDANQHLDLHDPSVLARILSPILRQENSKSNVSPQVIVKIINQTGAQTSVHGAQLAH